VERGFLERCGKDLTTVANCPRSGAEPFVRRKTGKARLHYCTIRWLRPQIGCWRSLSETNDMGTQEKARRGRNLALGCVVSVLFIGTVGWIIMPRLPVAGEASRKCACNNNLVIIGMAMKLYHRENGCFPAARVRDPASGKVHSWRVTLLPYLGHRELHTK